MTTTSNRGGAGRGQGRKPLPPDQLPKPRSVRLTDAEAERLTILGDGSLSKGVRWLLRISSATEVR